MLKKLACALCITTIALSLFGGAFCLGEVCAEQTIVSEQYARVNKEEVYLLKNPVLSPATEDIYFVVPKTYFVKLISQESDDFYKASYMDVIGYIKCDGVKCVSSAPQNAYASKISFRVFAQNGLNLRTEPTTQNGIFNKVTTVPFLCNDLQFIGAIYGEESVPNRGDTWYYCSYYESSNTYQGYIYAGYCDMLTTLTDNTESVTYIDSPIFETIDDTKETTTPPTNADPLLTLSSTTQIIIIIAVCLPALLIVFLLFKPSRIMLSKAEQSDKKSLKQTKKKLKHHGDYYEYD